jgi:hypothetical protein
MESLLNRNKGQLIANYHSTSTKAKDEIEEEER